MNVNKVVVMGRLTYDPEVRQSGNGKAYSRVSVAVNRPRAKDAAESAADFIDCVAFGERAEFLGKHFRKGSAIIIFGTLRTATRTIGDKKVKTTDVFIEEIQFGESKRDKPETAASAEAGGAAAEEKKDGDEYLADLAAADDEDLPF